MRMIALLALAFAAPAMAQDAVPDAADGYPLEARYTDNSDNFPRDEMASNPAPPVMLDAKGQAARLLNLKLEPGQTLLFRIDADGKATDIRLVAKDTPPANGEIRASFGSIGGNTSLEVLNKGPQAYNYKAVILDSADAGNGKPTSVCTLLPGITSYELWPYPIAAMVIGGFAPAPEGEMVCK